MSGSLRHIGVLGMHWGIRNRRPSSTDTSSEDHKVARAIKAKKVSEMSNEELKKLTTRLQLEKQLSDLSKNDMTPGRKFVTDVLTTHAKLEATAFLAMGSKLLAKAIQDKFKSD